LEGPTANFLHEKNVILCGAPSGCQNQIGLVEWAWETATNMARAFITDMQMPKSFWYWSLHQSVQVMNYFPCTMSGISTTPHELVYGNKPDLRILFCLFSTGDFRHPRDGSYYCSGISDSLSMQSIGLDRCRKSDGMIFYSPHSKELYVSSDHKLDEGHHTPTAFNLHYDGGIFIGLYNHNSSTSLEPYPEGTSVSFPLCSDPKTKTLTPLQMHGTVLSAPISKCNSRLPLSDTTASPYVIRLVDGSIDHVSPYTMDKFVVSSYGLSNKLQFPLWLGNQQWVMYLHAGTFIKGSMERNLDKNMWRFSQRCRNGIELFGVDLPLFFSGFQKYVDDGTLVPGWQPGKSFLSAGSTRHVSVTSLKYLIPPGSTIKALHQSNPYWSVWLDSYREEYDGLSNNNTFDIISEEGFQLLRKQNGVWAIPSMCAFTVKHINGVPTHAKSHIVVLGNLVHCSWNKSECFSSVVSIPMIHLLTALAVHNGRTLKQADHKLAFIQATLPPEELTIVKPPLGYPFTKSKQYWKLKKLYGFCHAPCHWYNMLCSILESP